MAETWRNRGKTIRELIEELSTFEDQEKSVVISIDGGDNVKPISLVGNLDGKCALMFYDVPTSPSP
jgi:hypothetical protein